MISTESAHDRDYAGACELVAYLRQSGQLTAGLILRSLLSGHTTLFEAALCELSGMPARRVAGLIQDFRSSGFAAVYNSRWTPRRLAAPFPRRARSAARNRFHERERPYCPPVAHGHRARAHRLRGYECRRAQSPARCAQTVRNRGTARRGPRARVRFAASGTRGNGHSPADGIDRARASRAITIDLDALEAEILQAA